MKKILALLIIFNSQFSIFNLIRAQDLCSPVITYTDDKGETQTLTPGGSDTPTINAPAAITCEANPDDEAIASRTVNYEWRFKKSDSSDNFLVRYEQDTEYTLNESGSYGITLYASFVDASTNDTITYESETMSLAIANSVLQMPNAFSPNGDSKNDYYNAKSTTIKSIIEFKGRIFNRLGQMLFEWDDPYTKENGWDGKYQGRDVPDGVYFVRVDAKGADGVEYHIKRDVNLLRGYDQSTETSSESDSN